jgi:hypothetical protein
VHDVAGAGHQARQTLGGSNRFFRMRRFFDGMDVEVIRARMARIAREHGLERCHDFVGARSGLAVRRPQFPGIGRHQRFGEEHLHVVVGRKPLRDVAHCIGICHVESLHVVRRQRIRPLVAFRECADQREFHRCRVGGLLLRRLHGLPQQLPAIGHRRHVVVRPQCFGQTPIARSADRVELDSLRERPGGFVMIERVDQPQALVEIGLRIGRRGRDLVRVSTEIVESLRTLGPLPDRGSSRWRRRRCDCGGRHA